MKVNIINSINEYVVAVNTRECTKLADRIDKEERFNVTEIRLLWGKNEGYIYIWPNEEDINVDLKEELQKIVDAYIEENGLSK